MKKKIMSIFMVLAITFPVFSTPLQVDAKAQRDQGPCYSQNALNLYSTQRRLWKDHVYWTRSYVQSALSGHPNKDAVLKRLLQNQKDIGNSIKPYYGDAAGNQLAKLLTEHIVLAGQLVDALSKGDKVNADKYNKEWYRNVDEIAAFLSKANPKWEEQELRNLLHMHLQILTSEVAAFLNKDWTGEIIAFDKGINHILVLADEITNGIMKQFPHQFRS
ncbi:glycosyltransferase [Fictibacillus phosphorivorans]|uniref:glycosyltransferase n=1 Tax=Fictibacillus phosphorivorans TaxID=1221500 RepID=UPI00203D073C|nr:glycosyltransferase [Fictibacillus phosphorivorans]MCM3719562.1 glycosyltransferase [Fictibacillus phosphorivorans]MCM3777253.1 glycosyltransferase [Fictibacillus phosphorivorans]